MKDQMQVFDRVSGAALDLAVTFGPKLLVAALILLAGYLAGRWAARMTGRALERLRLEPPVRALVERFHEKYSGLQRLWAGKVMPANRVMFKIVPSRVRSWGLG